MGGEESFRIQIQCNERWFINDRLGFISFGFVSVNEEPELHPCIECSMREGLGLGRYTNPTEYKGIFR